MKSWATPPARRPTASIFCACRSCCSTARGRLRPRRRRAEIRDCRWRHGCTAGARSPSASRWPASRTGAPRSGAPRVRSAASARSPGWRRRKVREDIVGCPPDDLVAGDAPHLLGSAIGQQEPPVRILDEDRGRHVLDDAVEELPIAVALLLGAPLLGEIDEGAERGRAPLVDQRLREDADLDDGAVGLEMTPIRPAR